MWTLCIGSCEVFSWLYILITVPNGECSSLGWMLLKGLFFTIERILQLSTRHDFFFLRIYQTVDLATLNVPAISLMDLFCFWSLTIVCFSCKVRSFDHMMWVYTATASKCKWAHLSRAHTVRFLIVFCDCCLSHCTNMIPMSNCRISVVLMSDCTTVKTRQ